MTKTYQQFLTEMAAPTEDIRQAMYYHGTSNENVANAILKSGKLMPPDYDHKKIHKLTPVKNKVYVTPHIKYAQIYGIGADTAGTSYHRITGNYAHVFGIEGKHLTDVQPDEDSVGEQIGNGTNASLAYRAAQVLHPSTLRKMKGGEYEEWANGGKQMLKKMSDSEKIESIRQGAHIAHDGELPISHAWRIHKDKVPLLKRDGSNFFDHAEKIL